MKILKMAIIALLLSLQLQAADNFVKESNRVLLKTEKGTLAIYPLTDNTVRVQFFTAENQTLPELVFESKPSVPEFNVIESKKSINTTLKNIVVELDKKTDKLSFYDANGKLLLSEKANSP
ncbi:MAG TPA: DUF4968 domain-containing protein, partial [Prolixibacteraceae bacterium]|nr:DUF4968 domain-containing protein [Prolixibacteraceae bacterium]